MKIPIVCLLSVSPMISFWPSFYIVMSSSFYCRSVLMGSSLSRNTYSDHIRRRYSQSWHRMNTFRTSGPLQSFPQQVEQQTTQQYSHVLGQALTSNADLLSWCSEPSQPQGLHQGWTQTSLYPLVIHSTGLYTTSFYLFLFCSFSNHSSNSIHNFGTQFHKNNNICFRAYLYSAGTQ